MKKLFVLLALACASALHAEDWKVTLEKSLPLLGHRNWIVVADSAYPWQVSPGVQTVETGASQLEVTQAVLDALSKTSHVRPIIFIDQEMQYVPESDAKGITAYRDDLGKLLGAAEVTKLPHEQIIRQIDEAGKTFHILLLKTTLTIPYTSVFIRLDCGYWSADSEKRLRALMPPAGK